MNEPTHNPSDESPSEEIDSELEARMVALVLGEASDWERDELNRLVDERPGLAVVRDRFQYVHGLLRDVGAGESLRTGDDWKLSKAKRDHLVGVLQGKLPAHSLNEPNDHSSALMNHVSRSRFWFAVKIAAVLFFIVGFVGLTRPLLLSSRSSHVSEMADIAAHVDAKQSLSASMPVVENGLFESNSAVESQIESEEDSANYGYAVDSKSALSAIRDNVGLKITLPSHTWDDAGSTKLQDGRNGGVPIVGDFALSPSTKREFDGDREQGQRGDQMAQSPKPDTTRFDHPMPSSERASGGLGGEPSEDPFGSGASFGDGGGDPGSESAKDDPFALSEREASSAAPADAGKFMFDASGPEEYELNPRFSRSKQASGGAGDAGNAGANRERSLEKSDLGIPLPEVVSSPAPARPPLIPRESLEGLLEVKEAQTEFATKESLKDLGKKIAIPSGNPESLLKGAIVAEEFRSLDHEVPIKQKESSLRRKEIDSIDDPFGEAPGNKNVEVFFGKRPAPAKANDEQKPSDELLLEGRDGEWFSRQADEKIHWRFRTGANNGTSPTGTTVPAEIDEKLAASEAFSTFSLHVSDVSFKLAQAAMAQGEWPEVSKIRIEEFVNAFDYGDPMPSEDEKVACRVEQAIHPFLQQRNVLRVSMRTAAVGRASGTPLRLTLLLDNSGSMERTDRQQTVRRAFELLASQLKPIDQVTLISFARQPRLLADRVSGAKSEQLVRLIDSLPSEGGTNIESALQLAFEKAKEQQASGAQNRIVLLTDGAVNLGDANPDRLARMITTIRDAGIAFDAAGISAEGLNDEVLEALTRKGDGRYYLLDSLELADEGFARQIAGALRPSAKNVKVQVEFNPNRVGRYKLLGFEKHILKKEDFRNDQVDAAEMAAAEAGVAVYQFEARPDGEGDVGSVSVRFRDLSTGQMVENRWPIPYDADVLRMDQAAPSLRIATAAAMFAAKLRGEPIGESVDLKTLSEMISGLPEAEQNTQRVRQLNQMIQQARQLGER